jgi:hypothetical protein
MVSRQFYMKHRSDANRDTNFGVVPLLSIGVSNRFYSPPGLVSGYFGELTIEWEEAKIRMYKDPVG